MEGGNERTTILPLATSLIAIYSTSLIMFALQFPGHALKALFFIKIALN